VDYQHKAIYWAAWVKVTSHHALPAWVALVANLGSFLNFHAASLAQKKRFAKQNLFTMYVYVLSRKGAGSMPTLMVTLCFKRRGSG
jgi:hypothetical protein